MKRKYQILRSTDAAEGNIGVGSSGGGSILDENLHGVDTSMPLLAPGLYEVKITSVVEAQNNDKTGQVLKIAMATTTPTKSTKGEDLSVGFPVFDSIPLTPTEKMSADSIKKRLAQFMEGVDGVAGKINPVAQWAGRLVTVKIKIAPEKDDYPESAKVKQYVNTKQPA